MFNGISGRLDSVGDVEQAGRPQVRPRPGSRDRLRAQNKELRGASRYARARRRGEQIEEEATGDRWLALPDHPSGFGKRLFGVTRNGTDYRVSLVPLGGYVKIVGLGPDESDVVRNALQILTGYAAAATSAAETRPASITA